MALTAAEYLSLKDVGLIEFFEKEQDLWHGLAATAYQYAKSCVKPTGMEVRPDDVTDPLESALILSDPLRKFLAQNRLTQKYWYTRFGHLILDELWDELEGKSGKAK